MPDFRRSPQLLLAPKVLVIDFRPPAVPSDWPQTSDLVQQYISTMRKASNNVVVYQVQNTLEMPKYPILLDGRQYTDATWTQALANDSTALRDSHGSYMLADYQSIIQNFDLISQVRSRQIDEVWMFGGPYFGFYESRMVGTNSFWCNGPAIAQNCRRFVVMGFNYQRSVKEMVHDFGHRAESILARQFGSTDFLSLLYSAQPPVAAAMPTPKNAFESFLLVHGTVHRTPGGPDYSNDEIAWVTAMDPTWFPPAVDPNKAN